MNTRKSSNQAGECKAELPKFRNAHTQTALTDEASELKLEMERKVRDLSLEAKEALATKRGFVKCYMTMAEYFIENQAPGPQLSRKDMEKGRAMLAINMI